MSRLPLNQNTTRPQTGNGGPEQVAATKPETVTDAKEKAILEPIGPNGQTRSQSNEEKSDQEVARFSLNVQAAITAEAASLLEKCADSIAEQSSARFARADAAIAIAIGRVSDIAAGLQQLRSELAAMAAGQADSVREMAGALRRTSGS